MIREWVAGPAPLLLQGWLLGLAQLILLAVTFAAGAWFTRWRDDRRRERVRRAAEWAAKPSVALLLPTQRDGAE